MDASTILQYSPVYLIIISIAAVCLQILDLTAGDTWALNWKDPSLQGNMLAYCIIVTVSLFVQVNFLIMSARLAFKVKKAVSYLSKIIAYVYVIFHLVTIILITILLIEQLVTSRYSIFLSELIVGISLLVSVGIILSLSFTSLKSYLSSRNKMVGVYGLAMIALSVQLMSAFFYVEANMYTKPLYITPDRNPWVSIFYTTLLNNLFQIYNITHVISFITVWIASVLITRTFLHKKNRIKYWTLLSLPVIYFLLQYSPGLLSQTGVLSSLQMAEGAVFSYLYNFILNTINVGSGVLFGFSFFIISRSLIHQRLKYYLVVCGAGIMIIFSSNVSTSTLLVTFPAWSIVSISFILPASFMILIGLDSSTFYIAGDSKVRTFLSRARKEFELFKVLGSSEYSKSIERNVHNMTKLFYDHPENQPLFVTQSESEDIKQYVGEILAEIKKSKSNNENRKLDNLSDE